MQFIKAEKYRIHFRKLYKNVITEITILKGEILIAEYLLYRVTLYKGMDKLVITLVSVLWRSLLILCYLNYSCRVDMISVFHFPLILHNT